MYQQCYQRWNSDPVEEDVTPMMGQKSFTSALVKSLCGNSPPKKSEVTLHYLPPPYPFVPQVTNQWGGTGGFEPPASRTL